MIHKFIQYIFHKPVTIYDTLKVTGVVNDIKILSGIAQWNGLDKFTFTELENTLKEPYTLNIGVSNNRLDFTNNEIFDQKNMVVLPFNNANGGMIPFQGLQLNGTEVGRIYVWHDLDNVVFETRNLAEAIVKTLEYKIFIEIRVYPQPVIY